ncbi:response regulator [Humisphaera borealis]|uniref:Response regulator transcription factor n=1 Tax=Humisphaera borealis TaxID=2807512 RepID=A0A7M2WVY8_9BACT|nr:response regulator transcription factor [Humisphaera borealis]QOV89382.1 response regulator transcription factor [Humisphaera borealis]
MQPKIRVLIADDHAILRNGLRWMIAAQPDMEVVGEANDFSTAVALAASTKPDVMTLDLTMPGGTGLGAISRILAGRPAIRIVVLTMHDDPAYCRTALAAGASGYLVKSAADAELITAIRTVHRGRLFVDMHSTSEAAVAPSVGKGSEPNPRLATLSAREREVMVMVAEGHTNQAIADRLLLSVKTVESYRARLMEKLGLANRAELTRFAMDVGLIGQSSSAEDQRDR